MPQFHARSRRERKKSPDLRDKLDCSIVLVGLMGAGKSCIGRRLAQRLDLPFVDADSEIEEAAGCSIEQIFDRYGEAYFRDGERRVIERLLEQGPSVLATGGGAYLDERTRAAIRERGVAVWLRADLGLLLRRTSRRDNRPLLKRGDPKTILKDLMEKRHPIYAEADVIVDSVDAPPDATLSRTVEALERYFETHTERLRPARASQPPASRKRREGE
jgi:shikimate kinase